MKSPEVGKDIPETTVPRGRGRPRDEEAKERILAAALEAVEELGFSTASIDAIADRAGASKATIYRWWPNKAALLIEALRDEVAHELPFPNTGDLHEDIRTIGVPLHHLFERLNLAFDLSQPHDEGSLF